MVCEMVDISVLIVDDDEISVAILANVLLAWKVKVLTAKDASEAFKTLRDFEGFFDLVISEFHVVGMCGFEFQKRIKDEFQIPIIIMSADNRMNVISKCIENGAAQYILKPFSADDFKSIWHYAMKERKKAPIFEEVNSLATTSLTDPKRKKNYSKRKKNSENQPDDGSPPKKPKMFWTIYLHNLFMLAIKQLGMDKAVPKKILALMNVPGLTREHVASHLQKYRIFLRKVIKIGMVEGLSHRDLRSKFASGIPMSLLLSIQTKYEKLGDPTKQYLQRLLYPTIGNALQPNITQVSMPLFNQPGRTGQSPSFLQNQYGNPFNQARLGHSSFGSNIGTNNIMTNMFGSNPSFEGGHGMMTSTTCLSEGLKYGYSLYQNYGSMGNYNSNHGLGNWNQESLNSYNILPQPNAHHYPKVNYCGIQWSDVLKMSSTMEESWFNNVVAKTNNNSYGLINETQNANMNDGLVRFDAGSNVWGGNANELPTSFMTTENKNHNNNNNNATSTIESGVNQLQDDLCELFLKLNDMDHFNEMNEISPTSDFLNSEIFGSEQVVRSLEQGGDVFIPSNEPLTNSGQGCNQMQGDDEFENIELSDWFMGDKIASTSTSSSEKEFDMDLIEALFGTLED